ncbi:MAG: hypothetical protein ACOVNU_08565 [Candidatus Kapaibacteriota bacterium]|jgi:hypothetical protein
MLKNIISNRILLIAVLLISVFGMNLEEGKGQCPPGYSSVTKTYWVNGCEFQVDLCYTCPISGGDNWIILSPTNPIRKVNTSCATSPTLTTQQVIEQLMQNIGTPNEFEQLCELQPCDGTPPIPPKNTRIKQPICWKVKKISLPNNQLQIVYEPCDDEAYCLTVYERCIDLVSNPPRILSNVTYTIYGNPECEFVEYDPINTIGPGQTSSCFRVVTNCD